MSLYLEISACNPMVYLTFPFSSFVTHPPNHSFLLANIFVVVHSQEVPMLHLVYCKRKVEF
jgi:hypothetical protein